MSSLDHQLDSDQTKEVNNKMTDIDAKDIDCSRLVLIFKFFVVKQFYNLRLFIWFTIKIHNYNINNKKVCLNYILHSMLSVHDDIVKSPSDDRDYLGFQLSNKLKVVVISDPTTEKAAASMNVQIGTLV